MNYTETITGLEREMRIFFNDLIDTSGKDSDHVSSKVLKVANLDNEDLHFNLDGGRYLTEIGVYEIYDNQGYSYNHSLLTLEQWAMLADAFKSKCKGK